MGLGLAHGRYPDCPHSQPPLAAEDNLNPECAQQDLCPAQSASKCARALWPAESAGADKRSVALPAVFAHRPIRDSSLHLRLSLASKPSPVISRRRFRSAPAEAMGASSVRTRQSEGVKRTLPLTRRRRRVALPGPA